LTKRHSIGIMIFILSAFDSFLALNVNPSQKTFSIFTFSKDIIRHNDLYREYNFTLVVYINVFLSFCTFFAFQKHVITLA